MQIFSREPHAAFSHPHSYLACIHYQSGEGILREADIPQGFRITKDVPVLRPHHFTIQAILFGVWKVAEASTGVNLTEPAPIRMASGSLVYMVRIREFHSECFATLLAKKAHLSCSLLV